MQVYKSRKTESPPSLTVSVSTTIVDNANLSRCQPLFSFSRAQKPGLADPCTLSALVVPKALGCATQTKMSELPVVPTFAHFFSLYHIAIRDAIIRAVTASFPSVQTFFFASISNYP